MDFFCPVCQKKHPAADIGVDMLLLFEKKIVGNLQHITQTLDMPVTEDGDRDGKGELPICRKFRKLVNASSGTSEFKAAVYALHGRLNRYLNGNPDTGNRFVVRGSEIASAAASNSNCVKWSYKVPLSKILDCYAMQKDLPDEEREELGHYLTLVPKEILQESVVSEDLMVYFNRITCDGKTELILEKVTDAEGGVFQSDTTGEMYGFVRVCPYCGHRLSEAVGRAPEVVVGLAGGERAGKTATMTAIAAVLTGGKYVHLGLDMQVMQHDKMWSEQLAKDIERYNEGRAVVKTLQIAGENMAGLQTRSLLIRFGRLERVFTFVDMPGEMWAGSNGLTNEFFQQYSGLYTALDCIWLMVSKFSVYQFGASFSGTLTPEQQKIFHKIAENPDTIRAADPRTLDSTLATLKSHLAGMGSAMPPIAVIITKPDVCMAQWDAEAVLKYRMFPFGKNAAPINRSETADVLQKEHSGRVQLKENAFWRRGSLVRSFLCEKNSSLPRAVERSCSKRFYFSLAPYGHPCIGENDPPDPPTPFHELFPLLWTMAITGMIPISHTCRYQKFDLFGNIKASDEGTENVYLDYRRTEKASPLASDAACNLFFASGDYKQTLYRNGKAAEKG